MKIRHYSSALKEIAKAAEYFDAQDIGLGNRFLEEIDQAISEIAAMPMAWPITKHGTRKRILLSPFPYIIHYKIARDELIIVAVAHQSREPDYWINRVK